MHCKVTTSKSSLIKGDILLDIDGSNLLCEWGMLCNEWRRLLSLNG